MTYVWILLAVVLVTLGDFALFCRRERLRARAARRARIEFRINDFMRQHAKGHEANE